MDLAQALLTPRNTAHRQYEALRAYLVECLPGPEVAQRYGYTYGALQQLVHQFRRQPDRQFFIDSPRPGVKTDDAVRQRIIVLRKQNLSIYELSHHPVPWRRCSRRKALRLQEEPAAEGNPGVLGPGWRAPLLLLCQQRSP